jgi:hypothetical protein
VGSNLYDPTNDNSGYSVSPCLPTNLLDSQIGVQELRRKSIKQKLNMLRRISNCYLSKCARKEIRT